MLASCTSSLTNLSFSKALGLFRIDSLAMASVFDFLLIDYWIPYSFPQNNLMKPTLIPI